VRSSDAPAVLCAGIAVHDIVLRVPNFPPPAGKVLADDFVTVTGGCAVNAAIAVARLGGRAHYAGPLGDAADPVSSQLVAQMQREGVGTAGVVRVAGARCPVSAILVDAAGERMIATYREIGMAAARAAGPYALLAGIDVVLADNRYPDFVRPICEAARRRGIKVVLDADQPTTADDPLFAIPTHVVFSAECLRETAGTSDLGAALAAFAPRTEAFLAVSNGPEAILYIAGGVARPLPVFKIDAVDTLAAGDVFHAGFALALAEGRDEIAALRFGAAAAGLKCARFGGSMGAPMRAEVEDFLAQHG
jgi:sugar/nucleoside kinase (ribokinase family)